MRAGRRLRSGLSGPSFAQNWPGKGPKLAIGGLKMNSASTLSPRARQLSHEHAELADVANLHQIFIF
jgi:hypothetical protein